MKVSQFLHPGLSRGEGRASTTEPLPASEASSSQTHIAYTSTMVKHEEGHSGKGWALLEGPRLICPVQSTFPGDLGQVTLPL